MCGIVGYLGTKNALEIILEGLTRLEYRGYDSAGVSLYSENGDLEVVKSLGKLENLKRDLAGKKYNSLAGIGHIRWATHGAVEIKNAHPHGDKKRSIVHNGIIENYQELKQFLTNEGHVFHTDTDSEVFSVLLSHYILKGQTTEEAMRTSFKLLRGNSAFLVIDSLADKLYTIKHGMSLVCGLNELNPEVFVSSDPYALVGMTTDLYFPEDDTLCVLDPRAEKKIQFFNMEGAPTENFIHRQQDAKMSFDGKGDFEHFMLKEIYEQPLLISKLFQSYFVEGKGQETLSQVSKLKPARLSIVACGTAWHAGQVIKLMIEEWAKIPVDISLASEFRYKNPLLLAGDVALFISQSGETADTLACQHYCKEKKIPTVSIVNVEGSGLYRSSDYNLLIHAGREVGVASTKAFTMQVLTGVCLALQLSQKLKPEELKQRFNLLSNMIQNILSESSKIKDIVKEIYNKKGFIFTGRGLYFPMALEGALKLKEIAYVHAEGLASGELKHGPLALVDEEMVNVALVGPELFEKTISNIEEVKARRGIVFAIAPTGAQALKSKVDYIYEINYSNYPEVNALAGNVVLQLVAYYVAKFKGTDIDQPRNLAKSVTVE